MLALQGIRVLVTRSPHQASALATHLQTLGAQTILIPTIEIAPPEDEQPLQEALARIDDFDWIVLTSANAVEPLAARVSSKTLRAKIAVIGPATAEALHQHGFQADLMPTQYVAESLFEALLPHAAGARILLLRAAVARSELPEALEAAGADVTIAAAYRNIIPLNSIHLLRSLLADPYKYPHAITFTSASTVTNLIQLLQSAELHLPETIIRASIGPITSTALQEYGFPATIEARQSTVPSLVDALVSYFQRNPTS